MKAIKILSKIAKINDKKSFIINKSKVLKTGFILAVFSLLNTYSVYAGSVGKMPPKTNANKNSLIAFLDKLYTDYIVQFAGVAALVSIAITLLFGIFNSGSATKRAETKDKVLYALICFGLIMILPWVIKELYKNL